MSSIIWEGKPQPRKLSNNIVIVIPFFLSFMPVVSLLPIKKIALILLLILFFLSLLLWINYKTRNTFQKKLLFSIDGINISIKYNGRLIQKANLNSVHSVALIETVNGKGHLFMNYGDLAFAVLDEYHIHRSQKYICFHNISNARELFMDIRRNITKELESAESIAVETNRKWKIKEIIFFLLLQIFNIIFLCFGCVLLLNRIEAAIMFLSYFVIGVVFSGRLTYNIKAIQKQKCSISGRNVFISRRNQELYISTDRIKEIKRHRNSLVFGKPDAAFKSVALLLFQNPIIYAIDGGNAIGILGINREP